MRLLQDKAIFKGDILYHDKSLYSIEKEDIRKLRGKEIGMILWNPSSSLNPIMIVGSQIAESFMLHKNVKGNLTIEMAEELMREVKDPPKRVKDYLTVQRGGMKEQVVVAMGIASDHALLSLMNPQKALT